MSTQASVSFKPEGPGCYVTVQTNLCSLQTALIKAPELERREKSHSIGETANGFKEETECEPSKILTDKDVAK